MRVPALRRPEHARRPRPEPLEARELLAVTIQLDYRFDINNFFGTPARRAVLQLAVDTLGSALNDQLSAIAPSGSNTWSAEFLDPGTGLSRSLPNLNVPADTIVLFVGGYDLPGAEAGFGGPGGFRANGSMQWLDTVRARGQAGALSSVPTDFGPWGGSIAFDTLGTPWFFGTTTDGLSSSQTDFFSVAVHELGHVLGIGDILLGETSPWSRFIAGNNTFTGPNSVATFGTSVPLEPGGGHWASGTTSAGMPASMTPEIVRGTRKPFTPLDFAALRDIGWMVQAATGGGVQFGAATFNMAEAGGLATISVVRPAGGGAATVRYATSDGTATAFSDYNPASGTLSFAAGETFKTFTVGIVSDTTSEPDETIVVRLSDPVGTTLDAQSQANVLILDDDRPRGATFGDYDGDRKADLAVYRPPTAEWLVFRSLLGPRGFPFGAAFTDLPLQGDFDGDGRFDLAVFRPSTAEWLILQSTAGPRALSFGAANLDVPVPADYDGDGKADLAVWRPTTSEWFILRSTAGPLAQPFGAANFDRPVPADYDGDGKADLAVFRPTTQGQWFILQSTAGPRAQPFGGGTDVPVPSDYDGDGKADLAVFRAAIAEWFLLPSSTGVPRNVPFGAGNLDVPVPADYDGDGSSDLAVFRPNTAQWFILQTTAGPRVDPFGGPNLDFPLPTPLAFRYPGGLVRGAGLSFTARAASARALSTSDANVPDAWPALTDIPMRRRGFRRLPRPSFTMAT